MIAKLIVAFLAGGLISSCIWILCFSSCLPVGFTVLSVIILGISGVVSIILSIINIYEHWGD